MLSRYTIYRKRPVHAAPLPHGIRQDTRHRTKHILRPSQEIVERYLANPTDDEWQRFSESYDKIINDRYTSQSSEFEQLFDLALDNDVFLGCSCPTKKNPNVTHCHTYLALKFMKEKFPELDVQFPHSSDV